MSNPITPMPATELEVLKARHEFWKWVIQFIGVTLLQAIPLITTLVLTWRNGDRAVNIERKVDDAAEKVEAVEKKIEEVPPTKKVDIYFTPPAPPSAVLRSVSHSV